MKEKELTVLLGLGILAGVMIGGFILFKMIRKPELKA